MKLVTYESGRQLRTGVVEGKSVVDVKAAIDLVRARRGPRGLYGDSKFKTAAGLLAGSGAPPRDMIALLSRGEAWLKALGVITRGLAKEMGSAKQGKNPAAGQPVVLPLESVRLRAPIARPGKITCVGLNYADHAKEAGEALPTSPIFFLKSSNTIVGPGDAIHLPPNSVQNDYEAEFAVVIGRGGRRIPEDKAWDYVAGYMIVNDVTARDMQSGDRQWFRGKSCDTFAPTGPWIITKDEVPDPHNLRISLILNGATMQDSTTANLIFKVPFLVSHLSQSLTWEPGDIISTGTPPGVGFSRKPPVFLKAGDTVSVTVERLGTLTNPVAGPDD
ncbi:MAG: fumarylacetoacetate hydrolase family protein [Terriglobia bacterium]